MRYAVIICAFICIIVFVNLAIVWSAECVKRGGEPTKTLFGHQCTLEEALQDNR